MSDVEDKILKALGNRRFRARTIRGIAQESNLSQRVIVKTLNTSEKLNGKVKIYPRKSTDGRVLLTTRENFSEGASLRDKFIDAFATKRARLEDEY